VKNVGDAFDKSKCAEFQADLLLASVLIDAQDYFSTLNNDLRATAWQW
jgi:hypothetical protein